jgi:CARDB/FG-GAP-like repeat/RTX calcium-binding nonapeptide repeat (4 copies)
MRFRSEHARFDDSSNFGDDPLLDWLGVGSPVPTGAHGRGAVPPATGAPQPPTASDGNAADGVPFQLVDDDLDAGGGTVSNGPPGNGSFASPETVTLSGSGLVFINTYDASVTTGYHAAIIAAENFLQSHFTNPVTINESFTTSTGNFVAANSPWGLNESYATLKAALFSHATDANDQAAVNSLPASDPSNGQGFFITLAEAKALGLWTANNTHTDGTVYLNSSLSYFYNASPASGSYDAISALEHELTEEMGRLGGLGIGGNIWGPMDLFRYSAPGQRDYTGGGDGKAAFFSVDGQTLLTQFNNPVQVAGDAADWNPSSVGQAATFVPGGYDSFGASPSGMDGVVTTTDLRIMDILGWSSEPDLVASGLAVVGETASYTISNIGAGSAGSSTTGIYLSTDSTITTSDTLLATHATPILFGGSLDNESVALSLPTNLTPGVYDIGVIADSGGQVAESNELNNVSNVVDVVLGNGSANTLTGTSAGEEIFGFGGNDTLNGAAGADTLYGGPGSDKFVFGTAALNDAHAAVPLVDHVADYDQGNTGSYSAAEGDQIDLSALLSAAFNHGSGDLVGSLVRAVASGAGSDLQIDPDGTANGASWTTIAHLDGIQNGEFVNVILDASQPAGTTIAATAGTTIAPVASDFNGDGNSDILWQTSSDTVALWELHGGNLEAALSVNSGVSTSGSDILGSGDFNGDGTSDILLRDNADGSVAAWEMNGGELKADVPVGAGQNTTGWHIQGTGDFNGDGTSDILWRNDNGQVALWEMSGGQLANGVLVGTNQNTSGWHIEGTGDFNGDGTTDVLWQNADGRVAIWEMQGGQLASGMIVGAGQNVSGWHIEGTGDFNGDGTSDILWQNDDGRVAIWEMQGGQLASGMIVGAGQNLSGWHIEGTGDFNGNGVSDILWRNDDGRVATWELHGSDLIGAVIASNTDTTGWTIVNQHYDLI